MLGEPVVHPHDEAFVAVVGHLGGLVAAAESRQVGHDHAVTGRHEHRHHVAVQVTPARFPVHQEDGLGGILRALVDVMDANPRAAAVGSVDFRVLGCERPAGQVRESVIRGTDNLHVGTIGTAVLPAESGVRSGNGGCGRGEARGRLFPDGHRTPRPNRRGSSHLDACLFTYARVRPPELGWFFRFSGHFWPEMPIQ
jgi:hypothetical protein